MSSSTAGAEEGAVTLEWQAAELDTVGGRKIAFVCGAIGVLIVVSDILSTVEEPKKWVFRLLHAIAFGVFATTQVLMLRPPQRFALTELGVVGVRDRRSKFLTWNDLRHVQFASDRITISPTGGWWSDGWWNRTVLLLPRSAEVRERILDEFRMRQTEVIHRRVAELS